MKTSLIITTYNWPESLELILKSILLQTEFPNEIIIADDGSKIETTNLINYYKKISNIPIIHIWQEDLGFRASEVRNKAIKECNYEYIIQIDGDTVLHKDFIKDHKNLATKNCFISGSRVLVGKETTAKKIKNMSIHFSPFTKGIINRFNAIRLPIYNIFFKPKNTPIEKLMYKIRGCNMSFWKEDIMAVNCYDENFSGWGREDSELVLRLLKKGVYLKTIKLAAIQYHLHHKENDRMNFEKNHEIMMESLNRSDYVAKKGIIKNY